MSILVSAHELSKTFAARPLFNGLTFSVATGDRIGLIGPNGAGKSTLLKILSSQTPPDAGNLSLQRGLKVGFLEQVPTFSAEATIFGTILEGTGAASEEMPEWEHHAQAHEIIAKFELDQFGEETRLQSLSGGWRKRVALARELVKNPDLLLLDEPTNHLDVDSILWLEGLLSQARFATITITHDRFFLQRVANRIVELDSRHAGGLLSVQGDYAAFLEVRMNLIASQERREVILKNTLRRETEWLRQGAKARTTKQQARIQRAGDLKSEVEDLGFRNQDRKARLDFQSSDKNPKKLVDAKQISKTYGNRPIFSGVNLMITPGTRIGLLGRNGSGKSTLIRVLLGLEEPTSGTVFRSEHLSVAYFDQTREALDPNITVLRTLCPSGETVEYRGVRTHIRSYLDRFLFTQGQMDMTVGKLSGGEQSRLLIARLMLKQANLLVLDEPTNDLDMATLAVLEECLTDFSGAVILVTHDRYFLDRVANLILAFPTGSASGALVSFADLSQWEQWHARQIIAEKERARILAKGGGLSGSAAGAQKKRKIGFKEQRELDTMEADIHAAEERLARLTHESTLSKNATDAGRLGDLTREMAEAQGEIDRLFRRWSELEKP